VSPAAVPKGVQRMVRSGAGVATVASRGARAHRRHSARISQQRRGASTLPVRVRGVRNDRIAYEGDATRPVSAPCRRQERDTGRRRSKRMIDAPVAPQCNAARLRDEDASPSRRRN